MRTKRIGKPVRSSFKVIRKKDQPNHPVFGWKLSEKAKKEIAAIERVLVRG